jgi:O-antigen ligase
MYTGNTKIRQVNYYVLHLILFVLPLFNRSTPLLISILFLTSFFNDSLAFRKNLFQKRKWILLLLTAPYILTLFGLFNTELIDVGLKKLEIKLSLMLLPVILLTTSIVKYNQVKELLRTYVFGVTIAALICLIHGLYKYYITKDVMYLFYSEYSLFHHPSYFAMYLNMGISILLIFIFNQENKVKIHHFLLLTFLMLSVYQTASKAGLIVLVVICLFAFLFEMAPRIKWIKSLIALSISVGVVFLVIFNSSYISGRFSEMSSVADQKAESSTAGRVEIWKSSLDILEHDFLFGVGSGDVQQMLDAEYEKRNLEVTLEHHKNAHNQYLETLLANGLFGLLSLVASLVVMFFYGIKFRIYLLSLYVFNVGFNFLTESMLEKQSGVLFYAIFGTLMISIIKETK